MPQRKEEIAKKVTLIKARKNNLPRVKEGEKKSKGLKKDTKPHGHITHFGIGFK